jgi:MFS family permease
MTTPTAGSLARTLVAAVPSSLLSQVGFYATLPLLPVLLREHWSIQSSWLVGLALFALSASMRGSSVLLSNWLQGLPLKTAVAGGLGTSAVAFFWLQAVTAPVWVVLGLALAGLGISVSALALRVFVAESLDSSDQRNTVFSAVQVVANVAAAGGPLVGAFLFRSSATTLLLAVTFAFTCAALLALALVPATRPQRVQGRPALSRRTLSDMVHDGHVRRAAATTAVGCFLYAQLFSAIAIYLAASTQSAPQYSFVFVMNAVLVIALQAPASVWMNRRMRGGAPAFAYMRAGVTVFAVSCAVLAVVGGSFAGVVGAVVVFSVAEVLFTPMLGTVFAEISGTRSAMEMFNVRQISSSVGESLGTFAGGAFFSLALAHDLAPWYWAALASGTTLFVLTVRRWPAQSPVSGSTNQPEPARTTGKDPLDD